MTLRPVVEAIATPNIYLEKFLGSIPMKLGKSMPIKEMEKVHTSLILYHHKPRNHYISLKIMPINPDAIVKKVPQKMALPRTVEYSSSPPGGHCTVRNFEALSLTFSKENQYPCRLHAQYQSKETILQIVVAGLEKLETFCKSI